MRNFKPHRDNKTTGNRSPDKTVLWYLYWAWSIPKKTGVVVVSPKYLKGHTGFIQKIRTITPRAAARRFIRNAPKLTPAQKRLIEIEVI
jgi:hypothetical protein